MKSNIKYRGLNSYVLSDKKTMLYKFAMIIILSSLMIVTIFSTIKIKISQSVTNVRYISEETGNDNINDSIEEENSADVNSDISNEKVVEVNLNVNLNDDKIEFLNKISHGAIKSYEEYGILPSITIAQAILESGWGQSDLAVTHNNLFGIKADSRWSGAIATVSTSENYNDTTIANFRKYDNIEDSIEDHGRFLYENSRYAESGLFSGKNYKEQAQALENAGYSTVRNADGVAVYADKLIALIEKYNLMEYDNKVK